MKKKKSEVFKDNIATFKEISLDLSDDSKLKELVVFRDGKYFLEADKLNNLVTQSRNLNLLIDSARSIMAEMGLDSLLGLIIETVTYVMDADRATLFLVDKEKNELWSRVAIGLGNHQEIRIPFGVGIAGFVGQSKETVNIKDAYNDSRFNPANDKRTGYRTKSILCMPVYNPLGEIIGVIQVLNKLHSDHFTESDENLLGAYSSLAGISIANAQAYDELQKERDLLEVRVKERTRDLEESRKKSDELLLNILPVTIADELKIDGKVKPKSYEMVSVLFTDFKGFTKISENMEPTEILNELDLCFYRFDMLMERFNLEKIKTIGDAYMCAGGIPTANQTNPIDAVLAGLEIQKFMDNLRISKIAEGKNYWELRLGIHTGPVIAGVVGQKKFAYDIWGDTVNTASRMESSGQPGKINVSSFTYKYIHTLFDCTYRGKIPAKNKGDIEMYFVERIKPELSIDGEGLQPNDKFLRLVEEYSQNGYPDSPNELNKSISS